MNDIIFKKREGGKLSKDEIDWLITGYVAGDIPDYQVSALLMAIFFRGLDREETFNLTNAMRYSGDTIDLSPIKGIKVDKHSTGGVGDKTTLIVAPLASACGVPIAKMSGRGLGFTGGTVDKMESIPGFRTALAPEEFLNQVNEVGMAVIGQTAHITPADKKLYALRDVTSTVDNFGLIASSIMSKKLAAGSDAIVLDVPHLILGGIHARRARRPVRNLDQLIRQEVEHTLRFAAFDALLRFIGRGLEHQEAAIVRHRLRREVEVLLVVVHQTGLHDP